MSKFNEIETFNLHCRFLQKNCQQKKKYFTTQPDFLFYFQFIQFGEEKPQKFLNFQFRKQRLQ